MNTRIEDGNEGSAQKSGMGGIAEMGRDIGQKAATAWQAAKDNITEKTAASARATDRVIREHPYESLGIAFGIGVLIGVLINRK